MASPYETLRAIDRAADGGAAGRGEDERMRNEDAARRDEARELESWERSQVAEADAWITGYDWAIAGMTPTTSHLLRPGFRQGYHASLLRILERHVGALAGVVEDRLGRS